MKKNNSKGVTPIAPTLKKLSLYEKAIFNLSQYTSVNACIQKVQTESDKVFTQKKNKENKNLEVIRTA